MVFFQSFQTESFKDEFIWLGSPRRLPPTLPSVLLGGLCTVVPTSVVRDLGFYLDSHLFFSTHISSVTRTCFYHLRQLSQIRRSLSRDSLAIQASVSNRLTTATAA